jgi:transcriptional regulator with XRE-family HTH domain
MTFGDFVKEKRLERELGLREFCKEAELDPSNWSKVERGLLPATSDRAKLEGIARLLRLKKGTPDWSTFFDLAYISQQRIPEDVAENEDAVAALPVFFRTVRGEKPSEEELNNLIELLKRR